jgi:hypothetical protein
VFSSPSQHGRFKNEFHSFLSTDAEVMFIMWSTLFSSSACHYLTSLKASKSHKIVDACGKGCSHRNV